MLNRDIEGSSKASTTTWGHHFVLPFLYHLQIPALFCLPPLSSREVPSASGASAPGAPSLCRRFCPSPRSGSRLTKAAVLLAPADSPHLPAFSARS
jgi:hypothetical protein